MRPPRWRDARRRRPRWRDARRTAPSSASPTRLTAAGRGVAARLPIMHGMPTFEDLVAEADSASVDGWDFSWLDGRATRATPVLGLPTDDEPPFGERVGRAGHPDRRRRSPGRRGPFPADHGRRRVVAAERGTGNQAPASARRRGRGHARRVAAAVRRRGVRPGHQPTPQQHPVDRDRPGAAPGRHLFRPARRAATVSELVEHFIGPQPEAWARRHPDNERAQALAAGLEVVDMRMERLRQEYLDIGAVVYFLRKVIWIGAGLYGAALPRTAAGTAPADRSRRAIRRPLFAGPRRGAQARLIGAGQPLSPRRGARPARAAGRPGKG